MAADLSKLSTEDLMALKSGDLSKVSDEGLLHLKGAPEKPVAGSQPLPDTSARMTDMGMALARGAITGGPIGVAAAGAGEGMKQFSGGMDRVAHRAGEAVSQAVAPYVPP